MMNRRNLMTAMVGAALGMSANPLVTLADEVTTIKRTGRKLPWRNWSGSQRCEPDARKAPATLAELQENPAADTSLDSSEVDVAAATSELKDVSAKLSKEAGPIDAERMQVVAALGGLIFAT